MCLLPFRARCSGTLEESPPACGSFKALFLRWFLKTNPFNLLRMTATDSAGHTPAVGTSGRNLSVVCRQRCPAPLSILPLIALCSRLSLLLAEVGLWLQPSPGLCVPLGLDCPPALCSTLHIAGPSSGWDVGTSSPPRALFVSPEHFKCKRGWQEQMCCYPHPRSSSFAVFLQGHSPGGCQP